MSRQTTMIACVAVLGAACADNLDVRETNVTPLAVARVLSDDRLMPSFAFSGVPIELTLDGSQSRDPDGAIRGYRWLSATRPSDLAPAADGGGEDAGMNEALPGRWLPPGAPTGWPDDIERPVVQLPGPGTFRFALWVTDDRGRVSDPATLTVELTGGEP